jgi:hypothetical protein
MQIYNLTATIQKLNLIMYYATYVVVVAEMFSVLDHDQRALFAETIREKMVEIKRSEK